MRVVAIGSSPQRHEVPLQSPFFRQPATQLPFLKSHTWPRSHCRSELQRPFGTHSPTEVSQKRVPEPQSAFVARTWPKEDPGAFVLDEVVGYLVTLLVYVALAQKLPDGLAHAGAFFAFRAFDVLKLQPARALHQDRYRARRLVSSVVIADGLQSFQYVISRTDAPGDETGRASPGRRAPARLGRPLAGHRQVLGLGLGAQAALGQTLVEQLHAGLECRAQRREVHGVAGADLLGQAALDRRGEVEGRMRAVGGRLQFLGVDLDQAGLADFDQRATLDDLRAAIAASGGADEALQAYLSERLAELIGADPARAQAVLGWVEKASPQAAAMYLAAIKQSEAAHHASVPPKLLSLAEQAGAPSELRAAALSALETQRRLDDSAMQRLRRIALDESSEQTAWLATRTLGRVLTEDFQRTGESGRYIKTLLDISGRSADTGVRSLALEMPSYGQPLLPGDTIDELARLLRRDPDRAVREMAALRLSLTEAPQRALKAYEEAFSAEQDLCVRWAMFRFALRAGGAQALPLLAKMSAIEPRLKRDYDEFQALYQKGVVDFERIWQGKAEHIQCMEEG